MELLQGFGLISNTDEIFHTDHMWPQTLEKQSCHRKTRSCYDDKVFEQNALNVQLLAARVNTKVFMHFIFVIDGNVPTTIGKCLALAYCVANMAKVTTSCDHMSTGQKVLRLI